MKKKTTFFRICKNKGADQLCGNRAADISPFVFPSYKVQSLLLAIFCSCTARFLLDLVGNPEDKFTHDTPRMVLMDEREGCRQN